MARVTLGAGKSSEQVLVDAFARLGCERLGGPSENGWSRVSDFLRCPYRYYLKHVEGLTSSTVLAESSFARDVGSYTHAILAVYYAGKLPDERYPGFRAVCPAPVQMIEALENSGADPQSLAEAVQCWNGYLDYWGEDGWIPMAVEMPAGDARLHTGRYDLVISVEDGLHDGLWVVDHKTTITRADIDLYRVDGEIVGHVLTWDLSRLVEVFGELRGVCVNVLYKGRNPQPPYARRWFPVDRKIVETFERDRIFWQTQINWHADKLQRWPRSLYGCAARYDVCLFWEHCSTLSRETLVPREVI